MSYGIDEDVSSVIRWLERQPGYWRGRASVRLPQPGVDVWSEQALRDARAVGEFELMAEQCEGK